MNLILFILACYGLTAILTWGHIFNKIRPNHRFFHCSQCVGFWVGIFLSALSSYTDLFNYADSLITVFVMGCLSAGTSYILNSIFDDDGIKIKRSKQDE